MRCHEKWVESKEKKNISMKYTGKKCLNFDTVSIISLTIKKYWIGSGKWKVRSGDPGKGLSEYVDIPRKDNRSLNAFCNGRMNAFTKD